MLSRSLEKSVWAFLAVILCGPGHAADGLDIATAESIALERDAGLQAFEARSKGLREDAVADGALPDPEIMLGAEGIPVDAPGSSDMMTMYKLGVRQRIPAGQSRRYRAEKSGFMAEAEELGQAARKRTVLREVRAAWLDWAIADRELEVARAAERTFAELVETTEFRYRAGRGRQMDINQARLERARLQQRILTRESDVDRARAELARWLGNALGPSAHPSDLPEWPEPDDHSDLLEQLPAHPVIQAEERRARAGEAETRLARQAYRPEWMVEAGYAHQRGNDPMDGGRMSDRVFGMVSFSLPLFTANRQDRRLAAARKRLDGLERDREERIQEYEARLDRALTEWKRYGEILQLQDATLVPEAERAEVAARSAYKADQASFDELVRARIERLDQDLERLETHRTVLLARTELLYLAGDDQ